ncbi:cyclic AMP response element-binding protein B isoform X7 [Aedes albopictus]|uniref:BZIP domain-containing protein n=1 Tax=Aedes albopictus TaxID=7160 RepID=A0ABM1YYW0_AEDAL|nr:cyclic AMP response element-binding protein B-like isoform X5 [Aedes albopictus]XP_029711658.1 cyclic AMP response element-binding protein B isoform X4 [Aedes albopictus]
MDNMVEENGSSSMDPLGAPGGGGSSDHHQQQHPQHSSSSSAAGSASRLNNSSGPNVGENLTSSANVVQILPPSHTSSGSMQAQSVIQQNQQSVIQTAAGQIPALPRGVLLVCNKPSSVIHTTQGSLQAIQIKPEPHVGSGGSIMTDTNSDDTMSDDEASPKKRRDLLTRRPSYHLFPNAVIGGNVQLEDQSRKREMRLQKNREAARECRRKKKEYIKCLENRVAVLENQNKALIEELKSLKELYCQQKND